MRAAGKRASAARVRSAIGGDEAGVRAQGGAKATSGASRRPRRARRPRRPCSAPWRPVSCADRIMPSARRTPRVASFGRVSCRNGCELRMPTQTGNARSPTRQRGARAPRLPAREVVQRRAPADQLVVVHDLLEALGRDRAARAHVREKRPHLLGLLGPAEGDQQHAVDRALRHARLIARVSSCTMSTSALTWSTGAAGKMPWPRLKTCPGRPAAASSTSRAPLADRVARREQTSGVEVALHARRRARAAATSSPSSTRQSIPITSPPASPSAASSAAGAGAEVDQRHALAAAARTSAACAAARRPVVGRRRARPPSESKSCTRLHAGVDLRRSGSRR